jgi:predicted ArsR family transcriptional regulator
MREISRISAEKRGQMAARFFVRLPLAYDSAFRRVGGTLYEHTGRKIASDAWHEAAKGQADLVQELRLPSGDAVEVAEAFRSLMALVFGPEWEECDLKPAEGDGVLLKVHTCPFLAAARQTAVRNTDVASLCISYCTETVRAINPRYELYYLNGMCAGDTFCQMKIEAVSDATP